MTVQAVFFDMGGTIETFGYTRELRLAATPAIQQRLFEAGIDLHLENEELYTVISSGLDHYKRWSVACMDELPTHRIWAEYVFSGRDVDQERLAAIAEELMVLVESTFYQRVMRPEMPAVLQAIQQMGLKMGVISNVSSRGLVPANLQAYGIIQYFDPIVLSSEYGRRKPDPAIFHYAARLANVPTSACVYVGDRVRRDIDGARSAGFGKAIQIKHHYQHGENDEGATPDAVIETMSELLDFLRADHDCPPAPAGDRKIRAFIFDAGDILYYRPARSEKFIAFLNEMGVELSQNLSQEKKVIEHQAYRGQITQDEYREAILGMYGITQPELVTRGKQALIADDANIHFFDGVPETLLALKGQGYLLAIVTDTANTISTKLSWFERGGFAHIWDSIISSVELGTRKPDPRLYLAALQQLGICAGQAVFVGHRTYELEGARAVGLRTIAFNYDEDARADFYIDRFADLLNVFDGEWK